MGYGGSQITCYDNEWVTTMFKWVLGGNHVFTNDNTVADMGAYVIPQLEIIEYSTELELLVPYIQSSHDIATQCTV